MMNQNLLKAILLQNGVKNKFMVTRNYSKKALSTNEKFSFEFSKEVEKEYEENQFSTKHHTGVMKVPCVKLPPDLKDAIKIIKQDYKNKTLYQEANDFAQLISKHKPPLEDDDLRATSEMVKNKLIFKGKLSSVDQDGNVITEFDDLKNSEKELFKKEIRQHVYNWAPVEYTDHKAFLYMWGRLVPDYAALVRIFSEIKKRRGDFIPRSLFDFGSGVGSVTWAADTVWPKLVQEAYNVDSSSSMLALSERLMKGGIKNAPLLKRPHTTYYRQFLPASDSIKYDLVVSSRSLFDVGNLNIRARTADILWKKVAPGGFLVLVETGSRYGYSVLIEIRDYLLEISRLEREKYSVSSPIHVFSPCPHDKFCPRFYHKSKTHCHFSVVYEPLRLKEACTEKFCYVVLQKEERMDEAKWPRIIQPVLKKHHHVITRTCTPAGSIREFVVTKAKHGAPCYQICKKCSWGDLLPINITNDVADENNQNDRTALPIQNLNDDEHLDSSDSGNEDKISQTSQEISLHT